MNRDPLVSIAMPCYNASSTLPRALASLIAQGYERWECLVVDDGSNDDPGRVVGLADDPRIRLIEFETNRGRGAARQAALDHARGDFLGMLDADDWFDPDKLATQVAMFRRDPGLVLAGTGMAIVDPSGRLAGTRCCEPITATVTRLGLPRVAHAPSLIRMAEARSAGYDPALNLAEDVDFLIRVLDGRRYAVAPLPLYVYSELGSASLDKIVGGLDALRKIFRKHRLSHPIASRVEAARAALKIPIYKSGFALGAGDRILERRSRPPGTAALEAFERARTKVDAVLDRRFAELAAPNTPVRPGRARRPRIGPDLGSRRRSR